MNSRWKNEEVEGGRTKKVVFLIAVVFLALSSGCITINSVNQPTSAVPGDSISTSMSVSLQYNTSGGSIVPAFAIKIPNDWSVTSVSYSGTGGASAISDTLAYNSSATSDIESKYPSGTDFKWMAYSGSPKKVDTLPAGATGTIRLTTGSTAGTYSINYTAGYNFGGWIWTDYELRSITLNNPPNTPVLSGPTSGTTGTSYTYSAAATDPNGNSIYYTFDWGDSSTTSTGYYSSGTSGSKPKIWSTAGTYNVRAKATDSFGASSGWSTSLTVTIGSTAPTSTPSATGSISVASSPSGADVYLDGTLKGPASIMLTNVSVGSHVIWCKKSGYEDFMQSVDVTAGGIATLTCSLTPSGATPATTTPPEATSTMPAPTTTSLSAMPQGTGSISVISVPDGAEVYIDGKKKGSAFITIQNISGGQHAVWCKKEGYDDFNEVVTVTGGETTAVTCSLVQSSVEAAPPSETETITESVTYTPSKTTGAPGTMLTAAIILTIGFILKKKQ